MNSKENQSKLNQSLTESDIYQGDSLELLRQLPDESVHLILSDIPYGIGVAEWDVMHNNTNSAYMGSSPAQSKAGAVFKSRGKPINGWSGADRQIAKEYYEWCMTWAAEWKRVLKPGGAVFVFAGRRLSHRCVSALEDSGFTFRDSLAWMRARAPHRAQRLSIVYAKRGDTENAKIWEGWRVGNLRPIYEPILWFSKPYKIGTTIADNVIKHGVGAYNEEAYLKYVDMPNNVIEVKSLPNEGGLHPTQKPILLMKALIELATQPNQIVLDPYVGSGTTVIAAHELGRIGIGYEFDPIHFLTAKKRLDVTYVKNKLPLK